MVPLRRRRGTFILMSLIAVATVSYNVFNALVHTNQRRDQAMVRTVQPQQRTTPGTTPGTAPVTAVQEYEVPLETRRPVILIMSQMRSGSSFVAEIFNQHPGAFYVFEPLWSVTYLSNGTYSSDTWRQNMLTALMTCRFEGLEKFWSFYLNDATFDAVPKSEALHDVCKKFRKRGTEPCPIPWSSMPSVLERSCTAKNFTVFKTIRVKDIDLIWSALEEIEDEIDLKIIHLVRDPRATIASRMGVYDIDTSYADKNVKYKEYGLYGLCRNDLKNMQPKSGTNGFLKDKYALVRYEDIIQDIAAMAERLYNFAGVHIHPDVLRWIQLNTKTEDVENSPFSRTRNAKETANHWRARLTFNQVKTIQDYCAETMQLLGYKFIDDDTMLRNMSTSLLGELNQDVMVIQ